MFKQYVRERKIASLWFGVSGLVSAFLTPWVTLYLFGDKLDIDSLRLSIILGASLIAAVLGFLLGYKILLLKSSETSLFKTVLYGAFGGLLALLILALGIALFLNYMGLQHCNPAMTGCGFSLFDLSLMMIGVIGFCFFMFGASSVGFGIISALLLYYFRSRYVHKS